MIPTPIAADQAVTTRRASGAGMVVLALGAALLVVNSVVGFFHFSRTLGAPLFDWTFYSGAVHRWLAGEQIYPGGRISTLGWEAGSGYAYPPASVPLMLPFAWWPIGAVLWETLVVGLLLAGLWAVVRIGWPSRPSLPFGIALALMAIAPGVVEGIALGNVNIATAGLLGLVWAAPRGLPQIIGLATVVKVFPFALAAPLGWRSVAVASAVAVGIAAATLPLVGLGSWADYVGGLHASEPLCGSPDWFNASLACGVGPFVGAAGAKSIGLAVGGVLLLVALMAGRSVLGMTAAGLAVMAPATELHGHYFAILHILLWIALATLARKGDLLRPLGTSSGT
jgi:hypothetical protein